MGDSHCVRAADIDQIQPMACILQIKFYWNRGTSTCLLSIHGHFYAIKLGLGSHETDHMACQAQSIYFQAFYRACRLTASRVTSGICLTVYLPPFQREPKGYSENMWIGARNGAHTWKLAVGRWRQEDLRV